ncbi:MAG: transcription termination factor Rho [Dehalococcoidia bacterium]|nr:transcription termination factor Rho [Dehalococcoidia bacterium]
MNLAELETKTKEELIEMAQSLGLENGAGAGAVKREDLVYQLLEAEAKQQGLVLSTGILELAQEGYGFLRANMPKNGPGDVYVSQSQIRRFGLRTGDQVTGQVRPPKEGERYFGLIRVEAINGIDAEQARNRPNFDNLTPIYPTRHLKLETNPGNLAQRMIDVIAPIGAGQRGMIVSPPKAGKTTLLKNIAAGISQNHPDVQLMVVLAGERPEEVTDIKRSIKGEVYSSTFDEPVEDHCRIAELSLERAKRLVESGKHVVLLLDSLTRLVRAYNLALPSTGRTLSGGVDPAALYPPKRFFGAARNTEEGGSLTIIASCLIDTGSRMDEVIYEEFKGTGNCEIHLDRRLAEKRVFPALDIQRSGTRREDLILTELQMKQVVLLRRMSSLLTSGQNALDPTEATEKILDRLSRTKSNEDFLKNLTRAGSD